VNDLDLFLFTPGAGGEILADAQHAVYWARREIRSGNDSYIKLELDDTGLSFSFLIDYYVRTHKQ